jgi:O-methyltransferase
MTSRNLFLSSLKTWLNKFGIEITRYYPDGRIPPDIDESTVETILKVRPFTMTSPERISALCQAVEYIIAHRIPGDIVECGVWKGGSMMAVAHTLLQLKDDSKNLFLFDTFDGMTEPTEKDVDFCGSPAFQQMENSPKEESSSVWCYSPLEEVRTAVYSIGYDRDKIHFIKGRVEETIPDRAPHQIALLRLDTDWYESTRHELVYLFPRLSPGGVVIIDDYGHWKGAREAVDEYIRENKIPILLNRIDLTGRIGIVMNH